MKKYKRIFVIVMDSLGIGAADDAAAYGDAGTDTLGHIAERREKFVIPNLQKIGMANLHPLKQVAPVEHPLGYYMEMKERSAGKDTMTGHWELMGLYTQKPFQTFTEHGFPQGLIDELEKRTGHKVIGNKSASGTCLLYTSFSGIGYWNDWQNGYINDMCERQLNIDPSEHQLPAEGGMVHCDGCLLYTSRCV